MFTGLVEEAGIVRTVSASADGAALSIEAKLVLGGLNTGDSIAVNGSCLSVTAFSERGFTAFAMTETLRKTTLGSLKTGDRVHLERALALGSRLGGHLVSGHIDAVATLSGKKNEGSAVLLEFKCPPSLMAYIVPKGSVALDGVSLTVIESADDSFSVGIIPHTAGATTLAGKKIGARVNLEVDMIAKYVESMLKHRFSAPQTAEKTDAITMNLLQEKGYL